MDKRESAGTRQGTGFQTIGPFFVFLVLFFSSAYSSESFLTVNNISNVLRQSSINAVIAIGMTFVILSGGIDLSVGSVIAVAGGIAVKFSGVSPVLAIGLPIAAGILAGLLNGLLVTKMKIPAFIATLATQMAIRGYTHLLIGDTAIAVSDTAETFLFIGKGKLFGILPLSALIMFAAFLISGLFLRYSQYGRNIYSVGGNEEAASMMGLKCDNVKIMAYIVSGFTAAVSGIILTSRLGTASPLAGTGYELEAISSVVLGETYLSGGRGKMLGTFWGALTMGLIANMFNMQGNISSWIQDILMGLLLLGIVLFQSQRVRDGYAKLKKGITGKIQKVS